MTANEPTSPLSLSIAFVPRLRQLNGRDVPSILTGVTRVLDSKTVHH